MYNVPLTIILDIKNELNDIYINDTILNKIDWSIDEFLIHIFTYLINGHSLENIILNIINDINEIININHNEVKIIINFVAIIYNKLKELGLYNNIDKIMFYEYDVLINNSIILLKRFDM